MNGNVNEFMEEHTGVNRLELVCFLFKIKDSVIFQILRCFFGYIGSKSKTVPKSILLCSKPDS